MGDDSDAGTAEATAAVKDEPATEQGIVAPDIVTGSLPGVDDVKDIVPETTEGAGEVPAMADAVPSLADTLAPFVNSERYADVTLVAEGREIRAHKAILCARSSHFRAMFTLGMREATTNVIEVGDISYQVLDTILNYLYSARYMQRSHLCCAPTATVANDKTALAGSIWRRRLWWSS
jgi:hypothetical protein